MGLGASQVGSTLGTPLIAAIAGEHDTVCTVLLSTDTSSHAEWLSEYDYNKEKKGKPPPEISTTTALGDSALWIAAFRGKEDTVALLLQQEGIRVDVPTRDTRHARYMTPLRVAACLGHLETVSLLLPRVVSEVAAANEEFESLKHTSIPTTYTTGRLDYLERRETRDVCDALTLVLRDADVHGHPQVIAAIKAFGAQHPDMPPLLTEAEQKAEYKRLEQEEQEAEEQHKRQEREAHERAEEDARLEAQRKKMRAEEEEARKEEQVRLERLAAGERHKQQTQVLAAAAIVAAGVGVWVLRRQRR